MSMLFTPYRLRELTLKNRIFVSPMCQYSAVDGVPNEWHLVHLGARAIGGAGLILAEATAICPEGRISPGDLGLYTDQQEDAFRRITDFVRAQGAEIGVQLAHAGRKASMRAPWDDRPGCVSVDEGGWTVLAPSAVRFQDQSAPTRAMTTAEIDGVVDDFANAARRAVSAGFRVVEVHAAHGYLLHQFLSPLANRRDDRYGGSLENRMRLPLAVIEAVRREWPAEWPVFVRVSATDWVGGGWDPKQTIEFARRAKALGADLIDCSSGGLVPDAKIPTSPGYQVPFAAVIREHAGIATGAVGLITTATEAERILAEGQADAVLLARELLRDPHWPLRAASELGVDLAWPKQYARAKRGTKR